MDSAGLRGDQRCIRSDFPSILNMCILFRAGTVSLGLGFIATAVTVSGVTPDSWPRVVDLDLGEACTVVTANGSVQVAVLSVTEHAEPDFYIAVNPSRRIVVEARAKVRVGDQEGTLVARPFQGTTVINGVRLYLEATRTWGPIAQVAALTDLKKAVRLSVLDAAKPWGPPDIVFPLDHYRWRSASYNNTWGAIVPYNAMYYHRGEDYGAIPDQLPVVSMFAGTIVRTPLSSGRPSGSNHVGIESPDGVVAVYAHMNYEHLNPAGVIGAKIAAGQVLGKSGSTWNGARNQFLDPHLHVGVHRRLGDPALAVPFPIRSSLFPMLIDAYLRKYPDPVLAIAGGYRFAVPGDTVELDALRSVPRQGEEIEGYEWILHDGSRVAGSRVHVRYDTPGLYSEHLIVRTKSGGEDHDFAQVRVFDPKRSRGEVGLGWFYHSPVRGIRSNTPVLFWNRLLPKTDAPVSIDFGDGSAIEVITDRKYHSYAKPGIYTAKLTSTGPEQEPLTIQMRVVVER